MSYTDIEARIEIEAKRNCEISDAVCDLLLDIPPAYREKIAIIMENSVLETNKIAQRTLNELRATLAKGPDDV